MPKSVQPMTQLGPIPRSSSADDQRSRIGSAVAQLNPTSELAQLTAQTTPKSPSCLSRPLNSTEPSQLMAQLRINREPEHSPLSASNECKKKKKKKKKKKHDFSHEITKLKGHKQALKPEKNDKLKVTSLRPTTSSAPSPPPVDN